VNLDPRVLARQLEQEDPEGRRMATRAIADVRSVEATSLLLSALRDEDWRVRKEAAKVAPSLELRADLVLALVSALDETANVGLRNAAVEALVAIGPDAVLPTVSALRRLHADGRKLALEVLGNVPDDRAIDPIASSLTDEDVNVRVAAAEALGGAGAAGESARGRAAFALTQALAGAETHVKLAALHAIVRLGAPVPWAILEQFSTDPVLRRHAILAAGPSDEEDALVALAEACGDPSAGFARDAMIALAGRLVARPLAVAELSRIRSRVGSSRGTVERIRSMASETDPDRRGAALVLLGLLGDSVPILVEALQDEPVASRAEFALRLLGSDAVRRVLEAGRASVAPVRAATLSLLPHLSDRTEPFALEALREALDDANPEVVMAAMTSLSVAGSEEDLPRIAGHASWSDSRVAGTARSALKAIAHRHPASARELALRIDARGSSAVVGCVLIGAVAEGAAKETALEATRSTDIAFLRTALDNDDVQVRHAAVVALASIADVRAADAVAFALADEADDVVLAAVRSLGRMRYAAPLLTLLRTTKKPGVLVASVLALGEASPNDAFEAARPLLLQSDPPLARAAVEAMGQLAGPRREEALTLALAHPEPEVVNAALRGLAREGGEAGSAQWAAFLEHESFEVRRQAASLLGTEGEPTAARARLRSRLERETDERVREAIAEALTVRPPS